MKKQLYILVGVIILAGCIPSVPAPLPTPSAPAANAPQQDWTFTVTINGTTHKAEGTYIYPHFDVATGYYFNLEQLSAADNIAYAPTTQSLTLSMLDKSESTYISGDHITLSMSINNLSLGVNNIIPVWYSMVGTSQSILDQVPFLHNPVNPSPYWSYGFQNTQGTLSLPYTDPQPSYSTNYFPINITDLGTQKGIDNSNQYNNPIPGNTIKGNYSGTVYSCDTLYTDYTTQPFTYHYEFNTPTQISIDFEAIREY